MVVSSSLFLFQSFSFLSNLRRLRAIIRLGDFIKPGMIQGLLGSNTTCRVVYKDFL